MLTIIKPEFIVSENIARDNIGRMKRKADKSGVEFRPHFKTHQSAEIGEWFRNKGIYKITVTSVTMAEYFAGNGWDDILIAFPVNIFEIEKINELAGKIKLSLLVESIETINFLSNNLKNIVSVWLKIDSGYGRAGLKSDKETEIVRIVSEIQKSDKLKFEGILSHYGNTYQANGNEEIRAVYESATLKMKKVKESTFERTGFNAKISIGDTPSCSVINSFEGIDEIRPGNLVFYDLMQFNIGSCSENQIAGFVACPVVSVYRERNQALIYGGAVHFSKEYLVDKNGNKFYGIAAELNDNENLLLNSKIKLTSLSQEHGIVSFENGIPEKIFPGNVIYFVPVHSCLAANMFSSYLTLEGKRISKMRSI